MHRIPRTLFQTILSDSVLVQIVDFVTRPFSRYAPARLPSNSNRDPSVLGGLAINKLKFFPPHQFYNDTTFPSSVRF